MSQEKVTCTKCRARKMFNIKQDVEKLQKNLISLFNREDL